MSEDGMRRSNTVLAGESEVESSAHAVTVNSGDGGGREVGHGLHQSLTHVSEAEGV